MPALMLPNKTSAFPARRVPEPMYSFLPMVIANCLRSPRFAACFRAPPAERPLAHARFLVPRPLKIEFDNLRGLFRRRHELPFLDGVLADLNEQRMSADHARACDMAIGCDDDFNFDFSGNVHAPRELGIRWRGFVLDLALAFVGRTHLRNALAPKKKDR